MNTQQWLINAMRPSPKSFDPSSVDPTITKGDKFWGGAQNLVENFPRATFANQMSWVNPLNKFVALSAQNIINAPLSDPLRAGSQIGKDARTGELNNFQTQVSDVGQAALPIITLLSLGHGVPGSVKAGMGQTMGQAAWQGAKAAAPWGALYGTASGLAGGRNQSAGDMTKNTLLKALYGLILGGATGAGLGMVGHMKQPMEAGPTFTAPSQQYKPTEVAPAIDFAKSDAGQKIVQDVIGRFNANPNDPAATKALFELTQQYLPNLSSYAPHQQYLAWDSINNAAIQPNVMLQNIPSIIPSLRDAIVNHLTTNPADKVQQALGSMLNPLLK